jgi:predicted nucleic acid-binding protein
VGENQLLVDTDILIDYINRRAYRTLLENPRNRIYYSAVTKKELLSKRGLKLAEKQAILVLLRHFRLVQVERRVAREYSRLKSKYPTLAREDALIAASAVVRKLPLLTRNRRHFLVIKELTLLSVDVA